MAQIAEDLFLLLLDNASAQPGLDRARRERVLSAAVLLDLALRLPHPAGGSGGTRRDAAGWWRSPRRGRWIPSSSRRFGCWPVVRCAPAAAVSKLRKHTQQNLTDYLEQTGQIRRIRLQSKRFNQPYAWPLTNRDRVGHARAALLSALFDRRPPAPSTAAIISLLHAVDGLGALLSLNDRGWRWVHARAGEIASGSWVDESATALPEMNLAVTASAVRPALM